MQIRDLTSANAVINLCGPLARDVLQAVSEDDVSNDGVAVRDARDITIGAAPVLAMRIGYVGELGWELHMPTSYAAHVYELLREPGGSTASSTSATARSTRCGWRRATSTGRPTSRPTPALGKPGLSWRVNMRKGDFCGRDALEAQREAGVNRKLCTFTLEEMAFPVSGEAIIADGEVVGFTTSANFGHTIGKPIAYGYLPIELADRTDFVIEVYGEPIPATRHDSALYDPKNARLKS